MAVMGYGGQGGLGMAGESALHCRQACCCSALSMAAVENTEIRDDAGVGLGGEKRQAWNRN